MKKVLVSKRLWIVLLVSLPFLAFVNFDWVTTSIDERTSVDFPSAPQKEEVQGNVVLTADGDKSKYIAVLFDFGALGADSAMVAAELEKPAMMEEVKSGMMGQLKGATAVSEKDTFTNGYRTFEFIFDMPVSDSLGLNRMHAKTIFVAAKMYSLSFIESKDAPKEADRKRFFNSIKIK